MKAFFESFGKFLLYILQGLADILTHMILRISEWLLDLFSKLPLLPSRSKILYHPYVSNSLLVILIIYILYVNTKAYTLFSIDKKNAIKNFDRIPEARLLKYCFLGGAFGGFFGMKINRHKTQKPLFTITVTLLLLVQIILYSFICGFFGFWVYLSWINN